MEGGTIILTTTAESGFNSKNGPLRKKLAILMLSAEPPMLNDGLD